MSYHIWLTAWDACWLTLQLAQPDPSAGDMEDILCYACDQYALSAAIRWHRSHVISLAWLMQMELREMRQNVLKVMQDEPAAQQNEDAPQQV